MTEIAGAEIKEIQPGIEDCFIYLMKKNEINSNERIN